MGTSWVVSICKHKNERKNGVWDSNSRMDLRIIGWQLGVRELLQVLGRFLIKVSANWSMCMGALSILCLN